MSARSRSAPWWGLRQQINEWGALTTLDEARARIMVQLDAQDEAGFVHMFGSFIWVDPRSKPSCPPGNWRVCSKCFEAHQPPPSGSLFSRPLVCSRCYWARQRPWDGPLGIALTRADRAGDVIEVELGG